MSDTHQLVTTEIGMVRIYLKPGDKAGPRTARSLWSAKPLYRVLVAQAKADGIMNAGAHHAHHGYSNHGPVHDDGVEVANPALTLCVELIGSREQLERFCIGHGAQLAGKVIVYKQIEQWSIRPSAAATSAAEVG